MTDDFDPLRTVVQRNCHISDAQHAGDYTLCVYLLKMREYFRWEKGFPFTAALPNDAVGTWLTEREALWEELAEQPLHPIPVDGSEFDPFDAELINEQLLPRGLVYSGGLGGGCRPHFFLARLDRHEAHARHRIVVAGAELARDLTAPPAMAMGQTIFIRRESLRRMIWEKVEEWRWRKHEGPMSRALAYYGFDENVEKALEAITTNEIDAVILHEIGELQAGELLGEEWHEMLASLPPSQAEMMARAVRDHLADCLSTLPGLTEQPRPASLHFYFGNLRGMRKEIFPGAHRAYQEWVQHDRLERLQEVAEQGSRHWNDVAQAVLDLFRRHGAESTPHIDKLIRANPL